MNELKPCPFCGSSAHLMVYVIEVTVCCVAKACRATITKQIPVGEADHTDVTKERVIDAWNQRAQGVSE